MCRYVLDHPEWLFDAIGEVKDGDYIIFDCPGESEYHVHLKTMKVFAAMVCTMLLFVLQCWAHGWF